jgi:hypothetical protein
VACRHVSSGPDVTALFTAIFERSFFLAPSGSVGCYLGDVCEHNVRADRDSVGKRGDASSLVDVGEISQQTLIRTSKRSFEVPLRQSYAVKEKPKLLGALRKCRHLSDAIGGRVIDSCFPSRNRHWTHT